MHAQRYRAALVQFVRSYHRNPTRCECEHNQRPAAAIPTMLAREARVQVVLSIQPLVGEEDRRLVQEALTQLEGVHAAHVDVGRGVVRIDGAASDVELLATLEALGKRAAIVTHVRDARSSHPAWSPSPVCACFSLDA